MLGAVPLFLTPSLLTPDMGIDRSYLSPAEPWRDESRDEMLRMTLRVEGKPDYTLVPPR